MTIVNKLSPDHPYRRRGKSTVQALTILAQAISNPGEWIEIRDHHGSGMAHRALQLLIAQSADRLGLEHIEFRSNPWGPTPAVRSTHIERK
jgi:hypothetical protein